MRETQTIIIRSENIKVRMHFHQIIFLKRHYGASSILSIHFRHEVILIEETKTQSYSKNQDMNDNRVLLCTNDQCSIRILRIFHSINPNTLSRTN